MLSEIRAKGLQDTGIGVGHYRYSHLSGTVLVTVLEGQIRGRASPYAQIGLANGAVWLRGVLCKRLNDP